MTYRKNRSPVVSASQKDPSPVVSASQKNLYPVVSASQKNPFLDSARARNQSLASLTTTHHPQFHRFPPQYLSSNRFPSLQNQHHPWIPDTNQAYIPLRISQPSLRTHQRRIPQNLICRLPKVKNGKECRRREMRFVKGCLTL